MAAKRTTKKKEPVTYEDFLAVQWEQWGSHHSHEAANIPQPSYQFTVGEKVLFGALNDCVVAEVLDGGRMLHLNFHDKGTTYGKPYDAGRKPRLCWWTEVDPLHAPHPSRLGYCQKEFSRTDSKGHESHRPHLNCGKLKVS
jgi:hypothetical protein